jgi:hypothetical protein
VATSKIIVATDAATPQKIGWNRRFAGSTSSATFGGTSQGEGERSGSLQCRRLGGRVQGEGRVMPGAEVMVGWLLQYVEK